MKKLLLLFIIFNCFATFSQDLLIEDCTLLNVGNVGTELTGVTPGQGNWLTRIALATTGTNDDFQIVDNGGAFGNVFQLQGHNQNAGTTAATSSTRILRKSLTAEWAARDVGNDILNVEYDFYTGATSASRNSFAVYVYSTEAVPRIIGGFTFGKNVSINLPGTTTPAEYVNSLRGITLFNNAGTVGLFAFGLATATPFQIVATDNTWIKIGFSFNKTTGEIKWRVPSLNINGFILGAGTGLDIGQIDLLAVTGGTTAIPNTAGTIGCFDNISVKATSTDTLLATNAVAFDTTDVSIYPNPATDFISISDKNSILDSVEITDINGRIVKVVNTINLSAATISVADLAAGIYMLKIATDKGLKSQKLIVE